MYNIPKHKFETGQSPQQQRTEAHHHAARRSSHSRERQHSTPALKDASLPKHHHPVPTHYVKPKGKIFCQIANYYKMAL